MTTWTAEHATHELLHILPLLNRIMISELRQDSGDETTMPQFRVLSYLTEQPLTMSAIARLRRVSLQAAGELVQSLVERGWIERTTDPNDRRQSMLNLTAEGRKHHDKVSKRMQSHLLPIMEKLSGDELAAVQVALPALHRVLTEESIDVSD